MAAQPFFVMQLRTMDTAWVAPPDRRELQVSPRVARALSFGHFATLVDWLWVRAAADPAVHHVSSGEHPPLFYDLDLASRLDPAFFEIYTAGAGLLVVIRDDDQGAKTLLERGDSFRKKDLAEYDNGFQATFWKDAWRIPMMLGYLHLFELNDLASASTAFTEASRLERAPAFLSRLADRFSAPGGIYEVGMRLLSGMAEAEKDERAKEVLLEKRKSLYLGQYLHELNRQFRTFLSKDARYQATQQVTGREMTDYWARFQKAEKISPLDPWGGADFDR